MSRSYRLTFSEAMDRIRQMEVTMAANPVDFDLEAERSYWQTRLASLEMLLCELLIKNEQLRVERLMFPSAQSDQGTALTIPERANGGWQQEQKWRDLPVRSVASAARQLRSEP